MYSIVLYCIVLCCIALFVCLFVYFTTYINNILEINYYVIKFTSCHCFLASGTTCMSQLASACMSQLVDPNTANSLLEDTIKNIIDIEAPMVTVQVRTKYLKWLEEDTKVLMRDRDNARKTASQTQLEMDWGVYRTLRNTCTQKQKHDRKNYLNRTYANIETEKDSSRLYSLTRQLLGWKQSGPPTSFNVDGNVIKKQQDLANTQANYYSDKIIKIKRNIPWVRSDPLKVLRKAHEDWTPERRIPELNLRNVTPVEVQKIISKMKNSHAYGRDLIDGRMIKLAGKILAAPIAHVINLSLGTQTFPRHIVILSYCPVTQLPIISKIAERSVQLQLLEHLEVNGLLSDNHHGYRRNTSTTTAMLQIMDTIATNTDNNLITASLSVDQSAAFDSVEHVILLDKLKYYKLGQNTLKWLESYLSHRSSFVAIGSAESLILPTEHGVPQGSCLGPLLYLLYVNEFPAIVKDDLCTNIRHRDSSKLFGQSCDNCGSIIIFADDAEFLIASNNRNWNQTRIEDRFDKIVDYLNANGLAVNQSKTGLTEYMTRQKRAKTPGIPPELTVREIVDGKLTNEHITDKVWSRILGGNLKNDLTWDAHLETGKKPILPAVRRQLGALSKLRNSISTKGKLQLVNGLVVSRLSYIISLWGNTTENFLKKAQICLNTGARFVLNCRKSTRVTDMMRDCNWLNVAELTEYHSTLQLWKVLRWETPRYLRDKFSIEEEMTVRTDLPRLRLTRDAWRNETKERWNNLPYELRTETSIQKFKICLRRHLKDRRETDELAPD